MIKRHFFQVSFTLLVTVAFLSCSDPSPEASTTSWWTEADRQLILNELDRTTAALRQAIDTLTETQASFRESPDRWSITEIVEHLEMQNQLHFREISVVANAPQYVQFRSITEGQDAYFTNYSTDTTRGQARWFLEPIGRFTTLENAAAAFFRARQHLTDWVRQTDVDLRKQFTFRTPVEGKDVSEINIGQVRDLHQLLLTGIAHTDRHLRQIGQIKQHPDYPQ